DGPVHLWDTSREAARTVVAFPQRKMFYPVYSHDGRRVAHWRDQQMLYYVDAATGQDLRPPWQTPARITALVWSADGSRLVVRLADDTVVVLEAESGRQLATLRGFDRTGDRLAVSADGKLIAAVVDKETIALYDTVEGRCLHRLKFATRFSARRVFSPS